jgi:hypothetical protein
MISMNLQTWRARKRQFTGSLRTEQTCIGPISAPSLDSLV